MSGWARQFDMVLYQDAIVKDSDNGGAKWLLVLVKTSVAEDDVVSLP